MYSAEGDRRLGGTGGADDVIFIIIKLLLITTTCVTIAITVTGVNIVGVVGVIGVIRVAIVTFLHCYTMIHRQIRVGSTVICDGDRGLCASL